MAQTEFAIWLTRQLADHNPPWKVADLARAIASQEVDAIVGTEYWKSRVKSIQNNISNIINGVGGLGTDTANGIALALGIPVVDVLFAAGVITTQSITVNPVRGESVAHGTKSAAEQKIQSIIAKLSTEDLEEAANILERLYRDRTAGAGNRSPKPRSQ